MREHQRPSLHSLIPQQSPSGSFPALGWEATGTPKGGTSLIPAPFTTQPRPDLWGPSRWSRGCSPLECPTHETPSVSTSSIPTGGDTSSSPTHFNSLVGWLEPLVPDTLKLVGGTMTSRVCPCAGGSSLARRGLPGSGRRGGWCFGTTWDHNGHRERQNP